MAKANWQRALSVLSVGIVSYGCGVDVDRSQSALTGTSPSENSAGGSGDVTTPSPGGSAPDESGAGGEGSLLTCPDEFSRSFPDCASDDVLGHPSGCHSHIGVQFSLTIPAYPERRLAFALLPEDFPEETLLAAPDLPTLTAEAQDGPIVSGSSAPELFYFDRITPGEPFALSTPPAVYPVAGVALLVLFDADTRELLDRRRLLALFGTNCAF